MSPDEAASLARAAVGYAGLNRDYEEVAKRTGLTLDQVKRILSPTDSRAPDLEERYAFGDAFGIPRVVMEEGFGAIAAPGGLLEQVSQLQDAHDDLSRSVAQIRGAVSQLQQDAGTRPEERRDQDDQEEGGEG